MKAGTLSIRDEIDHHRKLRFYEVFQAFHCLESLFFCLTVTTFAPPTSVDMEFFCCNQLEPFTFLSKVFVQILCQSQEIDLNLSALGNPEKVFIILISGIEIITKLFIVCIEFKSMSHFCRYCFHQIIYYRMFLTHQSPTELSYDLRNCSYSHHVQKELEINFG